MIPVRRRKLVAAGVALALAFVALVAADSLSGGRIVHLRDSDATETADGTGVTGSGGLLRVPGGPTASGDELRSQAQSPADDGSGDAPSGGTDRYEAIRNRQDKFSRFAEVPSAQLALADLTEPAPVPDNGASPEGQFRVACEYSHFGADDPIVFPGQPGVSHLHMFFGNTETDAFTTTETLVDSGGGTCSGYELNRSAYWVPALLDGSGNAIVPDQIIVYYKTKDPATATVMPQGLQMIAGNTSAETFEANELLQWACGPNGSSYNPTNRIPDCGGDIINAAVVFPNCWDGVNLSSEDHTSHLTYVSDNEDCPPSHPRRLPKISILIYWPGADSVDGWHLSSDVTGGFNAPPGGTLHADWWGGWNDETMELWTEHCIQAARNCSYGQTGTPRQLAGLNDTESYEGPNVLPLPGS